MHGVKKLKQKTYLDKERYFYIGFEPIPAIHRTNLSNLDAV